MDIEKLIERECKYRHEDGDSGIHDRAYEKALRESYDRYKDIPQGNIELFLKMARQNFKNSEILSSHKHVADCMVLFEIKEEIKKGN